MPRTAIQTFDELPVPAFQRQCTDIPCLVIWLIFSIFTLVASIMHLNMNNLLQINYPTDADGRTCGHELQSFPYFFFTDPGSNNVQNRVCVSACPRQGEPIMCQPTKTIRCNAVNVYDTEPEVNRLGGYCLPKSQNLHNNLLTTFNLHEKWNFLRSYDTVWLSLGIGFLIGLLLTIFVQFMPMIAVWVSVGLAGLFPLVLAAFIFTDQSPSFSSARLFMNVVAAFLAVLGVLYLIYLYWMRNEIRVCVIFIKAACNCLSQSPWIFSYILVYILFSLGLIVLIGFQYLAFSSANKLVMLPNDIYWQTTSWTWWNLLNIIQAIWAISFLRDSFNYIVSGNAVEWYFTHSTTNCTLPVGRLLSLNLGSVAFGSFLNGILFLPELIIDIFNEKGPCGFMAGPCHCLCGALINLMQKVREDVYAYINLTGAPYCVSASCCEYLCHRNEKLEGGQSANRIFRVAGHFWTLSLIVLVGYLIDKQQLLNGDVSPKALLCIFAGGFFIVTYFILIHSDTADGLLITYLAESLMAYEHGEDVRKLPPVLREDLRGYEVVHEYGRM